jgi:hypothetical protein
MILNEKRIIPAIFQRYFNFNNKEKEAILVIEDESLLIEEYFSEYFFKNFVININDEFTFEEITNFLEDISVPSARKESPNIDILFAIPIQNNMPVIIRKEDRLIYSIIPTVVNCNLPFLIHSNFLLSRDESKTQIDDNLLNKMIFTILPKYIMQFTHSLLKKFGNSYLNILYETRNFNIPETLLSELSLNKEIILNNFFIKTKTGDYRPLSDCFYDNFEVNNLSLIELFDFLYQDKGSKIVCSFLKETYGIIYNECYKIPTQDYIFLSELIKSKDLLSLIELETSSVMEKFLNSKYYRINYSDSVVYQITSLFAHKLNFFSLRIFPSDFNAFFYLNQLYVSRDIDYSENEQTLINKMKLRVIKDCSRKFKISFSLFDVFNNKNELKFLFLNGLSFEREDVKQYLINRLDMLYNMYTTVPITQFLFIETMLNNNIFPEENQKLKQLILLMKKKMFLSCTKTMERPETLHLGEFYTGKKNPEDSLFVSKWYFIENTSKSEWEKFFLELGFIS